MDYCTIFPEGWWSHCCAAHDAAYAAQAARSAADMDLLRCVAASATSSPALAVVRPAQNNLYTAAQRGAVSTVTPAASVVLNLASSNNFTITLNTATTLANPTNVVAGQSGAIVVRQDATGNRTLNFGSYWLFPNKVAPIMTTTANAIDMISYYVISPTEIIVTTHFNIGR